MLSPALTKMKLKLPEDSVEATKLLAYWICSPQRAGQ